MFAIKVCDLAYPGAMETTYHAYAYTVMPEADGNRSITMALEPGVTPHPLDASAINLHFSGVAYVMNENGKTIDTIRSNDPHETIRPTTTC